MSGNILVVDDEQIVREFFKDVAESLGGEVETAEDGDVAVEKYKKKRYDIVFMDMRMPHMNGLEACREILALDPQAKVVIMSGFADEKMMNDAVKLGAIATISKPFDLKSIIKLIESAKSSGAGAPGTPSAKTYYLFV